MNRNTTRSRRAVDMVHSPSPKKGTPQRNITINRPSINTTLSKAYGAPGRTRMPVQMTTKPSQNMLAVMKDMIEQDELDDGSDNEEPEDGLSTEDEKSDGESDDEREQTIEEKPEEEEQEGEDSSEVEVGVETKGKLHDQQRDRDEEIAGSPFSSIASTMRKVLSSSKPSIGLNFMTEDKIASEARIVRPREPLPRRLLRWREKCVQVFQEYGGSALLSSLFLLVKLFTAALVVLLALQSLRGALPEDMSLSRPFYILQEGITSPILSALDKFSSMRSSDPVLPRTEMDLSQLKALRDSTTAQFKHLKSRLDNIESTYNRLANKINTPAIPERKVNLFSPGSGLVVDPYMSSPTLPRGLPRQNLVVKWFSRWRSYPPSVQHSQISAFTPWEDMGDCWCSPGSSQGQAQLVVDLGRPVMPKELVVEHMFKDATLQIGSAPKDIELWVRIPDRQRRNAVIKGALDYDMDQNIDGSVEVHLRSLDQTWVRIGRWQYDVNGSSNIQTFGIQVPLEEFKTHITRLAFRVTSNWGPTKNVCIYRLKLHGLLGEPGGPQLRTMGY